MQQHFYSHGKLLLTGEYTVLDGSLALALPSRFGQSLICTPQSHPVLDWTSYDEKGAAWFRQQFDLPTLEPKLSISDRNASITTRLRDILQKAGNANSEFLSESTGYKVKTQLEFNRHWGLGSSSTLVANIAQWAEIDPYQLQRETFGGSGYDIACALHRTSIFYRLNQNQAEVTEAGFDPPFKTSLFFVYLNRKQNSRDAISQYRSLDKDNERLIDRISTLTEQIPHIRKLSEFQEVLTEHEKLMADAMDCTRVQDQLFPGFRGVVKSLGAWGGDFVLAAGHPADADYFKAKGYTTVLRYGEMVL